MINFRKRPLTKYESLSFEEWKVSFIFLFNFIYLSKTYNFFSSCLCTCSVKGWKLSIKISHYNIFSNLCFLVVCVCLSEPQRQSIEWTAHQYTMQDHWWFCKAFCLFFLIYTFIHFNPHLLFHLSPLSSQTQFYLILQTSFGLYICLWNMNCFMYIVVFKLL